MGGREWWHLSVGTRRGEEVRGRNSVRPGDRCRQVCVVECFCGKVVQKSGRSTDVVRPRCLKICIL